MLQDTIRHWIDLLLVKTGLSPAGAEEAEPWILLLLILVIGIGLDFLFRILLLHVVRRVVKRTKIQWDDILFDDKVLRRMAHIVTPIIVAIMLPIAFPHGG